MAGAFDFGSGMPLPPMAGPTTVYNSFKTFYDSSFSHHLPRFTKQSATDTFCGQRYEEHGYASGYGHNGYYHTQGYDWYEHGRRDHAGHADYYRHTNDCSRTRRMTMPQISERMDDELLDYLKDRRVSPFFVVEIDQFLTTHPELARLRPEWVQSLHVMSPLGAYRFFLKGYTKPARYLDNAFPEHHGTVNFPPTIPLIVNAYDIELLDFFDGYSYRYDLLGMIDHHVADLIKRHEHGERLRPQQFKLVCYVIWGQPVDAYKFFEYNYQSEWLPHRYLPEHVILHELPKASDYSEPQAYVTAHPREDPRAMKTFPGVRLQMARACDAGVDVIEVLIEEFVSDLAKRGFRRVEIDSLRRKAEKEVDYQRKIKGSADIVDLVMGLARRSQPSNPKRRQGLPICMRAVSRRITEAKKDLEYVLYRHYNNASDQVGVRRTAERELVLAVIAQATRDHSMTQQQAVKLLSFVPKSRRNRSRREKRAGAPDVIKALSIWL